MRRKYSSSSFATHHIFPPRPQVVALEQDAHPFRAYIFDQLALHHLLGDQQHRSARPAWWRRPTDHGDHALAMLGVQQWLQARMERIVDGLFQAALQVALADLSGGHGRNAHAGSSLHPGPASVHQPKHQNPNHRTHRSN